uniref:Cell division suppressor protein YneA n=1 Tax=Aeromonas sp. Ne-1 TaxID=1675689 RepID=A0A0H4JMY9_9GAMM|nr:LysM peptidoglycan-binding domain-containing protein [Aeromonas sp. Ne-1]AKO69691.1 cell division suppressor protein YneA [Aeromonas sp. Ne-1]
MVEKFIRKNSYTLILFSLMVVFALVIANTIGKDDTEYTTITIKSGETIWQLSQEYSYMSKLSQENFIKWVEKNNDIHSATLQAGQSILLPIEKDMEHLFVSR